MTERFRLPRSLNAKMLYTIVLSALAAVAVFFLISGIGDLAVDKIYMSPEAAASRKAEIYSRFSAYVTANNVAGGDSAAIARWTADNAYVTILVYEGESLNSQPPGQQSQPPASQYNGQYGKLYPMRFADGVYQVAIGDNSQNREYSLNRMTAVTLASVAFVAIMLLYVRRLSLRIIRLSREAEEIGGGDLEHPITAAGEDELSMLAEEMDNMRRSVIERMGSERQAWEANSELITAISHDIRTPMTSLIGYLGLLNESDLGDTERVRQFTASAYGKAMELKDLTDELFRYFLVFGRSDPDMNMEPFDGAMLLGQLLSELEFDLSDAGFSVRHIDAGGECTVTADPLYLKRVLDNLVSNIKKYADRNRPVTVLTGLKDGMLTACVSNTVSKSGERVESTRIGLRTCEKIMSLMGGAFTVRRDEEHFAAELSIPAVPGKPEEA